MHKKQIILNIFLVLAILTCPLQSISRASNDIPKIEEKLSALESAYFMMTNNNDKETAVKFDLYSHDLSSYIIKGLKEDTSERIREFNRFIEIVSVKQIPEILAYGKTVKFMLEKLRLDLYASQYKRKPKDVLDKIENYIARAKQIEIIISKEIINQSKAAVSKELTNKTAKWTFMVFLNGDNDLDDCGDIDVNEMKEIGSTGDVNIIVLQDHTSKPAQKLFIKKGEVRVLETIGKIDMGDYKEFVKFVKWTVENYPAEHYFVAIWNHGSGWKKKAIPVYKGISYDENSGNHITTGQLGESIKTIKRIIGRNIDVFGMDACLMQMIEVGFELKDSVDYIVASEEIEPGEGWAYNVILKELTDNPLIDAEKLSEVIVSSFEQYYKAISETYPNMNATLSSINCKSFNDAFSNIETFAQILTRKIDEKPIMNNLRLLLDKVQSYTYNNCDLVHLCKMINEKIIDDELNKSASDLIEALTNDMNKVITSNVTIGNGVKNSYGLAIYFPKVHIDPEYLAISFGKTAWGKFIKKYTGK